MLIISVIHKLFGTMFGIRGINSETWRVNNNSRMKRTILPFFTSFVFLCKIAADFFSDGSGGNF